jgi:hypothetical protein
MRHKLLLTATALLLTGIGIVAYARYPKPQVAGTTTDEIVPYTEVLKYTGEVRTVRMPAPYVSYDRGKEIFISSRKNPHHAHMVPEGGDRSGFFTVAIPEKYLAEFPTDFADQIRDKEILVTGKISWFQGDPHIVVTVPRQITFPN